MDSAHQNRPYYDDGSRLIAASCRLWAQPQPIRQQQRPGAFPDILGSLGVRLAVAVADLNGDTQR